MTRACLNCHSQFCVDNFYQQFDDAERLRQSYNQRYDQ